MDPRHFELASQFARLVGTSDLLSYLGVPATVAPAEAQEKLKEKRKYLQSMQSNPKMRDQALFLIKHYGAFEALLHDPQTLATEVRRALEGEKLPMLEMAIDSVLADGVLTPTEEEFVRKSALDLGVSVERYEEILAARCRLRGVEPPKRQAAPPPMAGFSKAVKTLGARPKNAPMPTPTARTGSSGWWDAAFTAMLLSAIPAGDGTILDIACGPAWSALTLLGERPAMRWIGVATDDDKLQHAQRAVGHTPFSDRIELRLGRPEALPLRDQSVDVVLSVMSLHDHPRPPAVFAEARRVLKPGGRVVAVEPDSLGHRFYFDGNLESVDSALQYLRRRAAARVTSTDLALGPRLSVLMVEAGLQPVQVAVHAIQGAQIEPISRFAGRVRGLAHAIATAAGLDASAREMIELERAIQGVEVARAGRSGLGCHVLPAFLCVGVKT
jgi:predicted O-methyltransferase YrrM